VSDKRGYLTSGITIQRRNNRHYSYTIQALASITKFKQLMQKQQLKTRQGHILRAVRGKIDFIAKNGVFITDFYYFSKEVFTITFSSVLVENYTGSH